MLDYITARKRARRARKKGMKKEEQNKLNEKTGSISPVNFLPSLHCSKIQYKCEAILGSFVVSAQIRLCTMYVECTVIIIPFLQTF